MARKIYERDTDELFARALMQASVAETFLDAIFDFDRSICKIRRQTAHVGHTGTIDLEIELACGSRLLIENKIDAAYSISGEGIPQPERYAASVTALRETGVEAYSVLLAPEVYLGSSRSGALFDRQVSYETLLPALTGAERAMLEEAIRQAEEPYEAEPNLASGEFFEDYVAHASGNWPDLVIKRNPNGNRVRPTESRTIYFDVPHTLLSLAGLPRPRMSLQCRDSAAPSASVKIMLTGMAGACGVVGVADGLRAIGGYIRPAGRSLGFVIDTPQLDTQRILSEQIEAVDTGLVAAARLREWWNGAEAELAPLAAWRAAGG
ncbi:hypothetical protein [Candidatus Halocynthiibacter alkanivorans]|uniref:hypothetical protein n=1 Tax=Candidatus Halocynthiibacter alkanivorans TaxID=2267619 RepID=UPI000DF4B94C|nr:hypothetical protein [Candidatus Halocynthiibacter alkanivorans]